MGLKYTTLCKTQCLHFDATGTIVSLKGTKYMFNSAKTLYHFLVVKHPKAKEPPVLLFVNLYQLNPMLWALLLIFWKFFEMLNIQILECTTQSCNRYENDTFD